MQGLAALASVAATGAAAAAGATPLPAPIHGVPLSLLLYASAGAFAGLAKSGPELWRSIVPPDFMAAWPHWTREVARVACVVVTLGINTLIGLASTWLLNRYVVHVDVADLWPFAVLVCFAIQRVAPPVLDALTDSIPAWIRRVIGGKG